MGFLVDDVALWDGTGSPVHARMSVEVRDGRVRWIGPETKRPGNPACFSKNSDLEEMAKNGTFLVPTMSVWDAMLYYARAVDWPANRKKRAEDLREGSRKAVSAAIVAGVKIALGTDAGGGAARHGRIASEAELMVECGMEPKDALLAGTSSAAELIGETERGTIEKGKIADMILLDANPLENVSGLRLIAAIFQGGLRVA